LRAVARYADWWHFDTPRIEQYAHKLNVLRSHCHTLGRNCDDIVQVSGGFVAIGATEAEARRIAETSTFRDYIRIVGSAEQVVEQLRAYVDLGVAHFIMGFADFPDPAGAVRFAEDVIPRFR
jgi:alkanesulfonate monooxygenase SsuD/methylene tetrahydromethanopterin reductase-like flavin-dependent oxidoreductase (luciferase family)